MDFAAMKPVDLRGLIRKGELTGPTTGLPVCPRVPCTAWGSCPPCRKCTRRRLKEIMQTERIKK